MVQMIAIQKCGRHRPGAVFQALPNHARALVALGRARYQDAGYQTRDLAAGEPRGYQTRALVPIARAIATIPAKRGRGRPRKQHNPDD